MGNFTITSPVYTYQALQTTDRSANSNLETKDDGEDERSPTWVYNQLLDSPLHDGEGGKGYTGKMQNPAWHLIMRISTSGMEDGTKAKINIVIGPRQSAFADRQQGRAIDISRIYTDV